VIRQHDLTVIREAPAPGNLPRYEIPEWRSRYGVVAGITGRGAEPGSGFDLGLWGDGPVGEVMSRWRAFRRADPAFSAVVLGNQVHGTVVSRVDGGEGWIQVDGVDGWVTTRPGILLTVTIADCIPVYLLAPGHGVALLHAGWRGTAGGILRAGIASLKGATGMSEGEFVMHCGVGICGECYEVGSEVLAGCGVPVDGPGPHHLDLRERLASDAWALGLGSVTTSGWCSAHDREAFFSHRASRGSDGRMVAYLGLPSAD
jgi:copper oxidase (laccase) domain-containing protein